MINLLKNIFNSNDGKERLLRYKKLVENNIRRYDKVDSDTVVNYLLRVIVEYMNFSETVQAFELVSKVQNNSLFEEIYRRISTDVTIESPLITIDNDRKDDIKDYIINRLGVEYNCPSIHKFPILLNPWNGERVIDSLVYINEKNSFDCERYSYNIENHYLYPMNIIVCNGGNHSQFSARIKNQGETIINAICDYSKVYSLVEFDGENFIKSSDNSIIDLHRVYDKDILFYSGVIFELGRYILEIDSTI